jgi:serine/threonine-protein kinase
MLDGSGNVKVMDFGIARLLDSAATATGGVMGTPAYMAPEQAESRGVDGRTDIYALGLIMCDCSPADGVHRRDAGRDRAEADQRRRRRRGRSTRRCRPVDTIVMRSLQKDPARRYQTVTELDDALAPCAAARRAGHPATAPAATWPTVAAPEAAPHPTRRARRLPPRGAISRSRVSSSLRPSPEY